MTRGKLPKKIASSLMEIIWWSNDLGIYNWSVVSHGAFWEAILFWLLLCQTLKHVDLVCHPLHGHHLFMHIILYCILDLTSIGIDTWPLSSCWCFQQMQHGTWEVKGAIYVHPNQTTSWWFQPIWKILVQLDHFPRYGVKIKNIWNHHPDN